MAIRTATVCAILAFGCGVRDDDDACTPGDQDGVIGGNVTFDLHVTDQAFSTLILESQNDATITLTLTNDGTTPHDFVVDCLPTPNDQGCPTTSCFPADASVAPLSPGQSSTITFITPLVEGIYTFRSDVAGDAQTGQFILQ
ncbi:MAG TPA: hypothetical protein VH054_02895 [Polyangiaceae bacterium]|jgi:hypothetical protein|nr:hypothetical protein [Polyangiaceae bacterium]